MAMLLTLSGQVLALAMHCPEQEMTMATASMEMPCHGHETKQMAVEMADDASSVAPAFACDLLCGFCLSCNSLTCSAPVTPLAAAPALSIDERQPFLPATSLENPFRPPIAA